MKSWKSSFTAILVAETLAIAGFSVSMPIIPLYLQDLGIVDPAALKFWAGIIQSTAAVTLAVFAPIWGNLADSYGRRLMLLRAMFGGSIIVFLMTFVNSPWQLLVLRAFQGCVTGTVAAATVLTAGIAPAASIGFALGLLQTGISIGNSFGPLVGGVISDFFGRRAVFAATSLILITAGLIVMRGVDDDTMHAAPKDGQKRRIVPELGPILASPVLLSLMAVTFALQAASSIAVPILPLFVQEMTPDATLVGSTTGMVLGAGAAASAVAAALVGRFSARIGYGRVLLCCLFGGALLTIPQTFVANPFQLGIFRVIAMFFLGGAMPSVNALIALNADKNRQGGIYGLSSSLASTGAALGPVLGSVVAAIFDFRAVFLVTAIILGVTTVGVRLGGKRIPATTATMNQD